MKSSKSEAGDVYNKMQRRNLSVFILIFLGVICYIAISLIRSSSYNLAKLKTYEADKAIIEEQIKKNSETWTEIARYARNLNRFFIYHRGFYSIPDEKKVTEADMAEDIAMINQNLNTNLTKITQEYNEILLNPSSSAAEKKSAQLNFHKAVEKLLTNYSYDVDLAKTAKLRDKISNYFAIENYLDTTREFTYYITDSVLNRSFSNVVGSNLENYIENEIYLAIDLSRIEDTFNGIPLNDSFAQNGISGFIMLPKDQPAASVVHSGIAHAFSMKERQTELAQNRLSIFSGILLFSALIAATIIAKKTVPDFDGSIQGFLLIFDRYLKLPLSIKLGLMFFSLNTFSIGKWAKFFRNDTYSVNLTGLAAQFALTYISVLIIIFNICFLIFIFQGYHRLSREFEFSLFNKALYSLSIMRKISPFVMPVVWLSIFAIGLTLFFIGIFVFLKNDIVLAGLCFLLWGLVFAMLIIFSNYTKLSYYIKNMHEGNFITIPEEKGIFAKPISMLNGLSEGLKVTLAEMVSAERTKTELITNVSHDLKTPLTSIINYVNLLKESPIEDSTAKEYINVLEQKSDRLRILIEDLFEAAKLSSLSMKLNYEAVDVVQLLEQSIGELSEKFENKHMEVKFKTNADKIILMLDGQRMWRVFENLLNNMANYSPSGSRAYINIENRNDNVDIIMKNISAFELDFNANELFERFKRGDFARSTEGSGLGLSIAKDIVLLHDGKLDISIDGDLFKVILSLKKN